MNSLKSVKEESYEQDAKMAANEHLVNRVETLENELAENVKTKSKKLDYFNCMILNNLTASRHNAHA